MKIFTLFSVFISFALQAAPIGERVSLSDYLTKFKAAYKILKADGVEPKPEVNKAEIFPDEGGMALVFPFCDPDSGLCAPGYVFGPNEKTEIFLQKLDEKRQLYTIKIQEEGVFSWEETSGSSKFLFRNHQYPTPDGKTRILEHSVER